jgi:predicted transposase YdaD
VEQSLSLTIDHRTGLEEGQQEEGHEEGLQWDLEILQMSELGLMVDMVVLLLELLGIEELSLQGSAALQLPENN